LRSFADAGQAPQGLGSAKQIVQHFQLVAMGLGRGAKFIVGAMNLFHRARDL
jgi:hypothetical protein